MRRQSKSWIVFVRTFLMFLIVTLVMGSLAPDADARRRRRHRQRKAKVINEKKLYERLGGPKALSDIVDEWMRLNLADARVASSFGSVTAKPERLGRLRRNMQDQLCEMADGPCQYKGGEMKKVHSDMSVSEDQFLIVADNLVRSMQKAGVAEREKNELLNRLGELRLDIVTESRQ